VRSLGRGGAGGLGIGAAARDAGAPRLIRIGYVVVAPHGAARAAAGSLLPRGSVGTAALRPWTALLFTAARRCTSALRPCSALASAEALSSVEALTLALGTIRALAALRAVPTRRRLRLLALRRAERRDGLAHRALEIDAGLGRELVAELVAQDLGADLLNESRLEVAELERAEGEPDEPVHLQPQVLQDVLDLAVLALAQAHGDPQVVALHALDARLDGPVVDAVDADAAAQGVEPVLRDLAVGADLVAPQPPGLGMGNGAREPAVVGEEQQALGVDVEPADGDDPRQLLRQAVEHRRAALRVARRRDEAARLVEEPQAGALLGGEGLAVDGDPVGRRDVDRRGGEDLAVEGDPAFRDHRLDVAARGDACPRDRLGDALLRGLGHGRCGSLRLRPGAILARAADGAIAAGRMVAHRSLAISPWWPLGAAVWTAAVRAAGRASAIVLVGGVGHGRLIPERSG